MRALLMVWLVVAALPTLAHADPLYVRAARAPEETPAPRSVVREPPRLVLAIAMREPEHTRLPEHTTPPAGPSLMEQLRERIYDELPVVSTAVVAPLPISSTHGTLAGVGVLGKF